MYYTIVSIPLLCDACSNDSPRWRGSHVNRLRSSFFFDFKLLHIYTSFFFSVLYDDFGGGRLNSPERFFLKKEKKLWRERKCILQPFFLVCCVFLSIGKRFFRQISSKGRDGPRGLADSCTELNSTASIDDPKLLLFSLSTTTLENDFNDHSIRFQYQRIRNPMSDIFK